VISWSLKTGSLFSQEFPLPRVTMQTIADHLGISKVAVCKALRHEAGVSAETRTRVQNAASELQYCLPQRKNYSPYRKTGNIGLITQMDFRNSPEFWFPMFTGAEQVLRAKGFSLLTENVSAGSPRIVAEGKVDGILIMGPMDTSVHEACINSGLPLVFMNYSSPLYSADAVLFDNTQATYHAARHLISLGHKRLGYAGVSRRDPCCTERETGVRWALDEAGITIPQTCWMDESFILNPTHAGNVANMLKQPNAPTAWICEDDSMAIRLMQCARMAELHIPKDISIIGLGDYATQQSVPPLTTVDVGKNILGPRAAEQLLKRMEQPGQRPIKIRIEPLLVPGGTTAAPHE